MSDTKTQDWQALSELTRGRPIVVERVRLTDQDVAIEGAFELPRLAQLSAEDQVFVAAFVRSHGSIKEMEQVFGVSYPTIKARLNRIAASLEFVEIDPTSRPRARCWSASPAARSPPTGHRRTGGPLMLYAPRAAAPLRPGRHGGPRQRTRPPPSGLRRAPCTPRSTHRGRPAAASDGRAALAAADAALPAAGAVRAAAGAAASTSPRRPTAPAAARPSLGVGRLLLSLSGTVVDVDTPDALVRIRIF